MQAFGKSFSKWWLVALIPVGLIALPVLLMGFFTVNDLAGAFFGAPAVWNRPWSPPPRRELVGDYIESERHLDDNRSPASARLTLRLDGSMTVSNLPADFGTSSCTLSGTGSWGGPDDNGVQLAVVSDQRSGSCPSGSYLGLGLAGHSSPFRLYWIVGDPDSGTGVWFRRQ